MLWNLLNEFLTIIEENEGWIPKTEQSINDIESRLPNSESVQIFDFETIYKQSLNLQKRVKVIIYISIYIYKFL